MNVDRCRLCGNDAANAIAISMAEYVRPRPSPFEGQPAIRFESIARCRDRLACKARVEALPPPRNRWLLVDTASTLGGETRTIEEVQAAEAVDEPEAVSA